VVLDVVPALAEVFGPQPLADDLELWRLESLQVRFERIGEQARLLAARLGKSPVRIEITMAASTRTARRGLRSGRPSSTS